MTSRGRIPDKPTVYLDTSTLSKAYRAAVGDPNTPQAFTGLKAWIEAVATNANLVFSIYHVAEFALWRDEHVANSLVAWLDRFPLVWARLPHDVAELEHDALLRHVMSGGPYELPSPFAPSQLNVLTDIRPEETAESLRAGLIGLLTSFQRDLAAPESLLDLGRRVAGAFNRDRRASVNPEAGRLAVQAKRRSQLEEYGRRSLARCPEVPTGVDRSVLISTFADLALASPATTPCESLFFQLIGALGDTAGARTEGSKKFQVLRSSPADIFHAAIGASYCDVFTCDRETSSWLGDFRAVIGRTSQLAEGEVPGGSEGFVNALMASI